MYIGNDKNNPETSKEIPISFPPYDDFDWKTHKQQWELFAKASPAKLRQYSEQATAAGIEVEFTQIPGYPGQTIQKIAQTWNADLVVMGSHDRTGLSELVLGSVSNYVMHHAPCSVLIVHS